VAGRKAKEARCACQSRGLPKIPRVDPARKCARRTFLGGRLHLADPRILSPESQIADLCRQADVPYSRKLDAGKVLTFLGRVGGKRRKVERGKLQINYLEASCNFFSGPDLSFSEHLLGLVIPVS